MHAVCHDVVEAVTAPFLARLWALMDGAHKRTLEGALQIVVTKDRLAMALKVSPEDLDAYLAGAKPLPQQTYLTALDIVSGSRR